MSTAHGNFTLFIDHPIDGVARILEELGDKRVNLRPGLPSANSPYAISVHCVGAPN